MHYGLFASMMHGYLASNSPVVHSCIGVDTLANAGMRNKCSTRRQVLHAFVHSDRGVASSFKVGGEGDKGNFWPLFYLFWLDLLGLTFFQGIMP